MTWGFGPMKSNANTEKRDQLERLARERYGSAQTGFVASGECKDDLASMLAEHAMGDVTTGNYVSEDEMNADVDEDFGGPFIETSARSQYGRDYDQTNIEDAEPAAFPTATGTEGDEEEEEEEEDED